MCPKSQVFEHLKATTHLKGRRALGDDVGGLPQRPRRLLLSLGGDHLKKERREGRERRIEEDSAQEEGGREGDDGNIHQEENIDSSVFRKPTSNISLIYYLVLYNISKLFYTFLCFYYYLSYCNIVSTNIIF